jgi:hypothetical protein
MSEDDIYQILLENYYSIGATGKEAIASIWFEISAGYFDDQIAEWGIDFPQLFDIINRLAHSLYANGKWTVMVGSK